MNSLSFKARVPVIDANIGIGHRHDRPSPIAAPDELLQEMERHGVDRANVYHLHGESISALVANEELVQMVDDNSAFTLQWVGGPNEENLHQLMDLHAAEDLASVRLNNMESHNPFVHWLYGDLLEWLQAEQIPLWVSLADANPIDAIETLHRYPDLVTVLVGAHYSHSLFVLPLLRTLPNAHLELSRYEVLGELERLIAEFGAHRLIYGSFYPRYAMGPMLFYLHNLSISENQLRLLCAGNLERILRIGGPES